MRSAAQFPTPRPPGPEGTGPTIRAEHGLHALHSYLEERSGPEIAEEIRRLVAELWDHLEEVVITAGGDARTRRPGPDGWSVASHLAAVEADLTASANRVSRILDAGDDSEVVGGTHREGPPVVPETRPVHALLRNVSQAAERLARLAETAPSMEPEGWEPPVSASDAALHDLLTSALAELDAHTAAVAAGSDRQPLAG